MSWQPVVAHVVVGVLPAPWQRLHCKAVPAWMAEMSVPRPGWQLPVEHGVSRRDVAVSGLRLRVGQGVAVSAYLARRLTRTVTQVALQSRSGVDGGDVGPKTHMATVD